MPKLEYVLDLNAPIKRVWAFYDTLDVLTAIMPPAVKLTIPNPPAKLAEGVRFTMWVSLGPLSPPLLWECVFTVYEPYRLFVDEQGKGPFALWRHEHHFIALPDGGTRLIDRITYEAPFGPFGVLADRLFIRHTLDSMFVYRHRRTRQLLQA